MRALACLPLLIACRAAAPTQPPLAAAAETPDPARCAAAAVAVAAGEPSTLGAAHACHAASRRLGADDPAGSSSLLESADVLYAHWIDQNPEGLEIADALYAHGELLYSQRRYDEAWGRYMQVAVLHPLSRHARFCLESAIFAAEEAAAGEAPPADGLGQWGERQIDALDLYVARYPDDSSAPSMAYKAAYLLYGAGLYDDARPRFFRLIVKDPGAESSEQAANLVLDQLVVDQDWATLTSTALALQAIQGLGSEAFQEELATIAERAALMAEGQGSEDP